jgi:hypothetical protein
MGAASSIVLQLRPTNHSQFVARRSSPLPGPPGAGTSEDLMEDAANPYGLGLEQDVNRLVDPNPLWPQAFAEEAARIQTALGHNVLAIAH